MEYFNPLYWFVEFKKLVLPPIWAFFKSERGNNCMKKFGPCIVVYFYLLQFMHGFCFINYTDSNTIRNISNTSYFSNNLEHCWVIQFSKSLLFIW